jgi:hypothetical protein
MTLVKSAPINSYAQKTDPYGEFATLRIVAHGESTTLHTYANEESIFDYEYPSNTKSKSKKFQFV